MKSLRVGRIAAGILFEAAFTAALFLVLTCVFIVVFFVTP